MKQICIIGLGRFGSHLAKTLAQMDCEVIAADADERAVNAVRDYVQRAVIIDARGYEALEALICPEQIDDVVVSLAKNLESSILCTLHLKQLGVKRIHAKASSEDHALILKALGATEVIFPEWKIAEQMAQRLVHPDLLDLLPLSQGYEVIEIGIPQSFVGKSILGIDLRNKYHVNIIAIKTLKTGNFEVMPNPKSLLEAGSNLVMLGKETDLENLQDDLEHERI